MNTDTHRWTQLSFLVGRNCLHSRPTIETICAHLCVSVFICVPVLICLTVPHVKPLDAGGAAGLFVKVDDQAIELDVAFARLKLLRET